MTFYTDIMPIWAISISKYIVYGWNLSIVVSLEEEDTKKTSQLPILGTQFKISL